MERSLRLSPPPGGRYETVSPAGSDLTRGLCGGRAAQDLGVCNPAVVRTLLIGPLGLPLAPIRPKLFITPAVSEGEIMLSLTGSSVQLPTFRWTTYDVTDILPPDWQHQVETVTRDAEFRAFPRTPVISREAEDVQRISRGRVHAAQVAERLPWLLRLYRSAFRELAQCAVAEKVFAAADERYGSVLNVQCGTDMRFECHIDSNPLSGLLFFSDHDLGAGGELIFAHDQDARSAAEIDRSCSVLRAQSGHLIFFDGRRHPHYVRPLADASGLRIVAVMNYYTASCPESTRPPELNRHLYGDG